MKKEKLGLKELKRGAEGLIRIGTFGIGFKPTHRARVLTGIRSVTWSLRADLILVSLIGGRQVKGILSVHERFSRSKFKARGIEEATLNYVNHTLQITRKKKTRTYKLNRGE